MESLYRKYRPLTFESVVGQGHIVSTLTHAVGEGRLSHAYLFCGPRGTGKTTMARILAKALLCERAQRSDATGCLPDGTCPECRAIADGAHPDVYELDAASRTGVDNVREEIINSVSFAPVRGSHKVYIIDEVHMLTTAAFNALLKTLEEPPAHVVFVLCTTDPQKLPETILSRCQRFDFRRISTEDLVGRMRFICEQEGFAFDDEALDITARHARGGMRDALSTLEQLSVFGGGAVRAQDARSLLGEAAQTVLAQFCAALASRDVVQLFELVREQADAGTDVQELTCDLVAHLRDVYTAAVAGPRAGLFNGTSEEVQELVDEAARFEGPDRLARVLIALDDAALEMRTATDPRLVLEIAFVRLARPETDLTLEALAERLDRLESQLSSGASGATANPATPSDAPAMAPGTQTPTSAAPAAPKAHGAATPRSVADQSAVGRPAFLERRPESAGAAKPRSREDVARPVATPAHAPAGQAPRGAGQSAATVTAAKPTTENQGTLQRKWADVVARVVQANPPRGGLLQSARAVDFDGERLLVRLPAGSGFAFKMLNRADSAQAINPVAAEVFGAREVVYELAASEAGTGAKAPAPRPSPGEPHAAASAASPAAARSDASATPRAHGTPDPAPATPAPRAAAAQNPAPQPSPMTSAAASPPEEDEHVPRDDVSPQSLPTNGPGPADDPLPAAAPHPAASAAPLPAAQATSTLPTPPQAPVPTEPGEDELRAMITGVFGAGVIFEEED